MYKCAEICNRGRLCFSIILTAVIYSLCNIFISRPRYYNINVDQAVIRKYHHKRTNILLPSLKDKKRENAKSSVINSTVSSKCNTGHLFNNLKNNLTCRPKILCKQKMTANNFWRKENNDINFGSTVFNMHEYKNPYENIKYTTRKSWGHWCKGKCRQKYCARSRWNIDQTLNLIMKEWVRISGPSEGNMDIFSVLMYGSLIASTYRGNVIMKWDTDVDFVMWGHDSIHIEAFMQTYNSRINNEFYLVLHPDWRCKFKEEPQNWNGRSYYHSNGTVAKFDLKERVHFYRLGDKYAAPFVAPNVRLYHKRSNWYIDVFAMYSGTAEDDTKPMQSKHISKTNPHIHLIRPKTYDYVNILRNDMFPLQRCQLQGIKLWCPNKPKLILKQLFRGDPIKPDHRLNLKSGCWQKV
jgi:hypothetical protein